MKHILNKLIVSAVIMTFSFSVTSFASKITEKNTEKNTEKKAEQKSVRISLVPFEIIGNEKYETFVDKISKTLLKAKADKAGLVVYPELFIADLLEASEKTTPLKKQLHDLAKDITPKLIIDLQKLAKANSINIIGGSFPRLVNGKIFNTSAFVSAAGEIKYQDKVYLTPDEKDWGWVGGSEVSVFDTNIGRIAILICYDVEMPQISDRLAPLSPEIIIVPSMTDTEAGFRRVRWTAQARAIEHRAYVLHVGTTGKPDPSWPHYAQASFLSPSEKAFPGLLSEGGVNSSNPLSLDLDLEKLRAARATRGIHPAKDQSDRQIKLHVLKR
jgi:predicted amidohydrolase